MKYIFLLIMFVCASAHVQAQLYVSAIPLLSQNADVQTLSLSNATVSTSGRLGNYHINPAGIGMSETFQVTRRNRQFGLGAYQLSVEGSFNVDSSFFSFAVEELHTGEFQLIGYSDPLLINRSSSNDFFLNTAYAYRFTNGMKVGAGLNYMKVSRFHRLNEQGAGGYDKGFSVDVGWIYEKNLYENEDLILESGFGVSLMDFGESPIKVSYNSKSHYPTTLRGGGHLAFETKDQLYGLSFIQFNAMASFSKIMGRLETRLNEETGYLYYAKGMAPFKALYKSWEAWDYWDGRETQTAKPLEQIWVHTGIEVTLLELLSFRFGIENAPKFENALDKFTFGLGLDLYYLSIDYARVDYTNGYDGDLYSLEAGNHLQFKIRIPLNGHRPNSIINAFLKKE